MKTQNTNLYGNYDSRFGGIIYQSDFDTTHSGNRNIANRIAADWRFDQHCRKNEEARNLKAKEDNEQ